MSNRIFPHRGLFQKTVGTLCWLGSVGECCLQLSVCVFSVAPLVTTDRVSLFQVLFCADLKKFQGLKEKPQMKQPKKEEEGERILVCKKTKIKQESNGTVKKSASHKKGKVTVKKERVEWGKQDSDMRWQYLTFAHSWLTERKLIQYQKNIWTHLLSTPCVSWPIQWYCSCCSSLAVASLQQFCSRRLLDR